MAGVLAVASTGRIVLGAAFVVVGLAMLVFNRRVTESLVASQREGIGVLLGSRRELSDKLHQSRAFVTAARVFVITFALFWTGLSVALMVTSG